jgi:hypothetical protein
MYTGLRVKYPLFLSHFNQTRVLSTDFRNKNLKYQISWKSVHWEPSASIQLDTRTGGMSDMMTRIFSFRNFEKARKNCHRSLSCVYLTPAPDLRWLSISYQSTATNQIGLFAKQFFFSLANLATPAIDNRPVSRILFLHWPFELVPK